MTESGEPGMPAVQNLTRFLDAGETQGNERRTVMEVAERVFEVLRVRLSLMLGAGGFATLLARTLALARTEFPWLAGVAADKNGSLTGRLGVAVQEQSPPEAVRGVAELLTRFATLLATFIGADLTNQLLEAVWQDLESGGGNESSTGGKI